MRPRLTRLDLCGFKTIEDLSDFQPGDLTVLIGANGAGKSNFISFFRMLHAALTPPGQLQFYVALQGGASALLHQGAGITQEIEARLTLALDYTIYEYVIRLTHAAGDTLIFAAEVVRTERDNGIRTAASLGSGQREAEVISNPEASPKFGRPILNLLKAISVYQFHNTASTARIRNKFDVADNRYLKEDGGNLAPFLYRLQNTDSQYFARITETIRLILPFFVSFELYPEPPAILLRWREAGSDNVFNASQASDGMLRTFALIALLQQPETDLPDVLILDEPELGLHPYAIEVVASLIRRASRHVQVIVATQSVSLIDRFEPGEIVVVDRTGHSSAFHRLDAVKLNDWLETYTLSELWEKNVIGGVPYR